MTLQVLDALGIKGKVFALGTSQGGWIVVRMYLLQPHRIAGIIPLGTSLDYESDRSRKLGNFNAIETLTPPIEDLQSAEPTPDFVMPDYFRKFPIYTGFGQNIDQATVDFVRCSPWSNLTLIFADTDLFYAIISGGTSIVRITPAMMAGSG